MKSTHTSEDGEACRETAANEETMNVRGVFPEWDESDTLPANRVGKFMRDSPARAHREIVEYAGGHLRVLGPPASGKTELLIERFRYLAAAGIETAVVTYARESADRLTAALLPANTPRFGRVPVYTYHTLAREIAGAMPAKPTTVVGEMEEAVLLRGVLPRIGRTLESDYRSALESTAFQRTLLGVLHVLSQNGISSEKCEELASAGGARRVRDLLRVYAEYRRYLESRGFSTYYDEAWRSAGLVAQYPACNPFSGVEVILIDDFQDVDPGQYALIRAVAPPDGRVRVSVFGDPTGARFREKGTTDRYCLDVYARQYRPLEAVLRARVACDAPLSPVVGALLAETVGESAGLFGPPAADDPGNAEATGGGNLELSLGVAEDETAEAGDVADRVASLLSSGRYGPSEVAVAAREKHRSESTLVRAFRERGLLLDTGRPPRHPFAAFVSSLLRWIDSPQDEAAQNAATSSPYFARLGAVFASLEGGAERTGAGVMPMSVPLAIRRTAEREGVLDLALFLERWMKAASSAGERKETSVDLHAFLSRLADEWDAYVRVVAGAGASRSLSEFLALSRVLAGRDHGAPGARGRVGFYSCHELSSRRFPVVFVVGCSELLFPALPSRGDYIPHGALQDVLRAALVDRPVELYAARPLPELLKDEYALLFTVLTRADDELHLSAPRTYRGTSCPAPSRILELIPEDCIRRGITRSPAPNVRFFASLGRGEAGEVETGHRASDLWRRPTLDVRAIDPDEKCLSPSSITAYTTCPRRYFYERILHIEDDKAVALAFGSLFHNLMRSLAHEHRTHEALKSAIRSDQLDGYVDRVMEEADAFSGTGEIDRRAARFHLRDMAERFVELDSSRRDDYRVEATEEWVEFEHRGRRFGGIADRIDLEPDGSRVVIDYKTGGGINKKGETVRRKVLPGCDDPEDRLWQVPIYLRGARSAADRDPAVFCYYVVRPGDEDYVAGLFVGENDAAGAASVFDETRQKRFAHLTRRELEACLDEAAVVADDLFGQKREYVKTRDRKTCSNCRFRRVCERTA